MIKNGVRIGLLSRIDAGSNGYRRGLITQAFKVFEQEGTHFNILLGGLVSKKAIHFLVKKRMAESRGKEKPSKEVITDEVLNDIVKELREAIPRSPLARFYIMTSPANDGEYGEIVARRLIKRRRDIRYWRDAAEHFPIKGIGKNILGLVPKKESWRSEYDSAPVDREVKDHQKRTTRLLPDFYAVGCFASSIIKPQGEVKRCYFSVPALHKLDEIKTSENQIGITVAEVVSRDHEDKDTLLALRTYSFKDLVGREREFIEMPDGLTNVQKQIFKTIKERGALTIGLLSDSLGISRKDLTPSLRELKKMDIEPKICLDEASGRYDFNVGWVQKNLIFPDFPRDCQDDVLVGFGCLHAGSVHTEYNFFVNELPNIILDNNATILAGAGDFIEGLKHNLIERGEVIGGLNYTWQELFAAHLVSQPITKVFKVRFQNGLENMSGKKLGKKDLRFLISSSLISFNYIKGNHDEWEDDQGVTSLTVFRYELINVLKREISKILDKKGYHLPDLDKIIENKVVENNLFSFSSGISVEMHHPHMARAKTTVLRLQDSLQKSNCQIVLLANFHVATSMDRWEPELGQRTGMQFGAIVRKTKFEENKGKKLDTGVGCLRVRSHDKRIIMTEKIFYVAPNNTKSFDNSIILGKLEEALGIS